MSIFFQFFLRWDKVVGCKCRKESAGINEEMMNSSAVDENYSAAVFLAVLWINTRFSFLILLNFWYSSSGDIVSCYILDFYCCWSCARGKPKKKLRIFLFCYQSVMWLCVNTTIFFAYEEDPLTSFSLGLVSLIVGMGFLLFLNPPPPPRFPRSRWAFGGAPFAELVVFPAACAVNCVDEFCDCWADDFSLAFTSTIAAVVVLLLVPLLLLLVVLELALFP